MKLCILVCTAVMHCCIPVLCFILYSGKRLAALKLQVSGLIAMVPS